jgi:fibronectin type 3 domain-containing protein
MSFIASNRRAIWHLVLLVSIAIWGSARIASAQTYPGKMGVNLSTRRGVFVDMGKTLSPFTVIGTGNLVPTDSSGWPTQDAGTLVFDDRAIPAWAPPLDDPAGYQPDMGGTYKLSFTGQATLGLADVSQATFANQTYNSSTNITTADVNVTAGGPAILVVTFSNTKRTAASATNTGITNVHMIRPGYPANTTQVFTNEVLTALQPYSAIRVMDWSNANFNPGYYGDPGHHIFQWADRTLPNDANVQGLGATFRPAAVGIAWEYAVMLANTTGKDIWITVPVSASGSSTTDTTSYIYKLAQLIKNGDTVGGVVYPGLNAGLHVYVEHSNEVWNFGFGQYTWNKLEAVDSASGTGSLGTTKIKNDGTTDQEVLAHRRHAERQYQIAQIFAAVFGAGSMNTTVRSVYCSWFGQTQGFYTDVLNWMNGAYGAPSGYTYAIAAAPYFGETPTAGESVATILANMTASSNSNVAGTQSLRTAATNFGVKLYAYEGGPANADGTTTNVGNGILAHRDPGMKTLLQNDLRNNFFVQGGDFFCYYNLAGTYSRYGSWGSTDDEVNLNTQKVQAIYNVLGYAPGVPGIPGSLTATGGNTQVALTWTAGTGATSYNVKRSTVSGSGYATVSSPTTTSYTNTGLTNGTTYYYVVTSVNASGQSANSNQASATPQAGTPPVPTGLTATAGNTQVVLSWNASSGATAYDVKRSTVSGSGYATINSPTGTSYTNTGLTNGTTYYYVVAAKNASGSSANSSQVSATPVASGTNLALNKPATASTVEATGEEAVKAVDGNSGTRWASLSADPQWIYVDLQATYNVTEVKLNWETACGKDYLIQVSPDASTWTTIKTVTGNTTGGVKDYTGLSGSGRYVRMYGTARATGFGYSLFDFEVYGSAGGSPPAAPTGLTATAGNAQVALSWTASSGATAYDVKRSTVSGSGYATVASPTTTSYTNTGLTNGTTYYFVVDAKNANGTSANSSQVSATPAANTTNRALNKPAFASSIEATGEEPAKAVDGNSGTRWTSLSADPQWIYVDLQATFSISRVKLNWETACGKDYLIQVSPDASTWTTIKTVTGNTTAGVKDYTGLSGSGRYVRVYGTARATGFGYSLFDLEVY